MEERILILKESVYKSDLNSGLIAFMALLCVDHRVPMFLEKDVLIDIVVKHLKQMKRAEFPDIAIACEQEVSKLLPTCDLKELRKLILEYYIVYQTKINAKIKQLTFVSNKKVLDFLDGQLYINILNCVYDLMMKASKICSMDTFSKKIKIGKKTCEILYPEYEFDDAIYNLALDLKAWIHYNFLDVFCLVEEGEEALYLKVKI